MKRPIGKAGESSSEESSVPKGAYTCSELFNDVGFLAGTECSTQNEHIKSKSRIKTKNKTLYKGLNLENLTSSRIEKIWSIFCEYLNEQIKTKKAINIPQFGKILENQATGKRTFSICDAFVRLYRIHQVKSPIDFPNTIVDVNFSMLAFKTKIPKDEIKFAVSESIECIGNMISDSVRPVMINFGEVGTLYADHRRVQFAFGMKNGKGRIGSGNAAFLKHALESSKNLSLKGCKISEAEEREGKTFEKADEEKEEKAREKIEIVPPLDLGFETKASDIDASRNEENNFLPDSPMAPVPLSCSDSESENGNPPLVQPLFFNPKSNERNRPGPDIGASMAEAFERHSKLLAEEVSRLKKEDAEIEERNWRSEMEYKERLLASKRDRLEMNAFLVKQSKERQARDMQQEKEMKEPGINVESLPADSIGRTKLPKKVNAFGATRQCKAFPMEAKIDPRIEAKNKSKLRRALCEQMQEKKQQEMKERVDNVAEERFIIDCTRKLMQDERQQRLYQKYKERRSLRSEWQRQKKLSEMQRLLQDTKDGKNLSHNLPTEGLLSIRPVSSSRSTSSRVSKRSDKFSSVLHFH